MTPVAYDHRIADSPDDLAQRLEQLLDAAPADDADDAESAQPEVPAEEPPSEIHQQMDLLRDQLEMAFDEVVTRISRLEHRLATSAFVELEERSVLMLSLLHELVDRGDAAPPPPNDLSAQIEDNRLRVESRLESLHSQISLLRDVPPTVDVSALEDAADRGALRNAADIATVRQGVDNLSDLVRLQEKSISELRSTLEWIKERLLLR